MKYIIKDEYKDSVVYTTDNRIPLKTATQKQLAALAKKGYQGIEEVEKGE